MWYSPTPMCLFNPLADGLGNKSCAACDGLLSVAPNGDVLPCSSYPQPVGNLLQAGLRPGLELGPGGLLPPQGAGAGGVRGCEDFPPAPAPARCTGRRWAPANWPPRGGDMPLSEARFLPDPRRRGEIQFVFAKSLPYHRRLAIILALLAVGFVLQAYVSLPDCAGLLLAASLLGIVKGYSNVPPKMGGNQREWRGADRRAVGERGGPGPQEPQVGPEPAGCDLRAGCVRADRRRGATGGLCFLLRTAATSGSL